jgi:two-component system, OmpR family, response regulator MprA
VLNRSLARVLIVEDDENLAHVLAGDLKLAGYEVMNAKTGLAALEIAAREQPDVVLLDLGLPDLDGLEVARRLRADNAPVIIAVTARVSVSDRVDGLYAGADDYITKPFALEELRARLHAQLRLRRPTSDVLEFGSLKLEPHARRCTVSEIEINLSTKEFELLEMLARRPGRIFSQSELFERTYQDSEPDSNAIEVRISAIRRKLREAGLENMIRTIRGAGYAFRSPD